MPVPASGQAAFAVSPLSYRPEIDGLRAVAVAAVALFHARIGPFGGGYVGVDVFFVVSGYLITSLILHGLGAGRFSLRDFYVRRARRLLPALFLVMAACSVLAWRWMLPYDLESFGKSVLATSLFANNLLLLRQAGYWAPAAEFNPLLHTWSLGVEEQFYLVFPLLLMLCRHLAPRRLWTILGAAAVASLAGSVWAGESHPSAQFLLLPTRAWELVLGSFCVRWTGATDDPGPGRSLPDVLGAVGLGAILVCALAFGRRNAGPGLSMLISACGTALVIVFARGGTLAARMLSARPLVGLGLISYGVYLWHVPALAFARIYGEDEPSRWLNGALLVATLPVAYLSWRLLERPVRTGQVLGRRAAVRVAAALTAGFAGFGIYLHAGRGLPGRLYPDDTPVRNDRYIAYNERGFAFAKDAFARKDALKVLVVGNSFARDFINMTVETFDMGGVEIAYRDDVEGCLPAWRDPRGPALLADADVVVIATRTLDLACAPASVDFARALGKAVFIVGSKYFGRNLNWIARVAPDERRDRTNPLPVSVLAREAEVARRIPPENYIPLLPAITRDGRVPITDGDGRLISPDRTHLTREGARYLGRRALLGTRFGDLLSSAAGRRAPAG